MAFTPAGAGFQIIRPDGSKVTQTFTYPTVTIIDTFYTNSEDYYLITPETLEYGVGYSLIEEATPLWVCSGQHPVYFDVTENDSIKDDGLIVVEVTKANVAQKGVIKISKTGEVFSTVTANSGIYQPVYEVRGLSGAVFAITAVTFGLYAAEKLTAADGMVIPADGLIEIVSINEKGQGVVGTDLPIGNYYLKEHATDNHDVLSDEKYPIIFEGADQDAFLRDQSQQRQHHRQQHDLWRHSWAEKGR